MRRVTEAHTIELDLALQLASRMAARAQARRILDLRPRPKPVRTRDVLHDLIGRLQLAHRLRLHAGGVMAFHARDLIV